MQRPTPTAPGDGLRLLHRVGSIVLTVSGSIFLALSAGVVMNPPQSDTVVFTYTVTNTGSQPISDLRVQDPAVRQTGRDISCPRQLLEPGGAVSCVARVPGPNDSAHEARVAAFTLSGITGLSAGLVLARRLHRSPDAAEAS